MRVTPLKGWCTLCLTIVVGIFAALSGCAKGSGSAGGTASTGSALGDSLPECPKSGDFSTEFKRRDYRLGGPAAGLLSVAGRRTNIPEFHDCQKLIGDSAGVRKYLTRVAVFSADDLQQKAARIEQIRDSVVRSKVEARVAQGDDSIFVVGEIYAPDGDYPPLGIKQHFNCLFLYPANKPPSYLEANIVPVGSNEVQCKSIPHTSAGTILEVHRTDFGDVKHVPDVARWDWDPTHNTQYIGVGCHKAWCDIGPVGFVSSNPHAAPPVPPNSAQMAVKGWYDEQTLGFPSGSGITVGTVTGTFVPMPDLGDQDGTPGKSFEKFKAVATVAIDGGSSVYFNKLNLAPSPITAMTDTVYLCRGTWEKCALADSAFKPTCGVGTDPSWWAKIVSPKPGGGTPSMSTAYFCITRRDHKGIKIPGVVRWRWAIKDETMWISCMVGCCELEADSKSIVQ